jgi:hypothetical protein
MPRWTERSRRATLAASRANRDGDFGFRFTLERFPFKWTIS